MMRSGEEAEARVSDRLAAAGAVLADVPELRREAVALLDLATNAARMPGAWQSPAGRGVGHLRREE